MDAERLDDAIPNAHICNRRLAAPYTNFLPGPWDWHARRTCRTSAQSRSFTTSLIGSAPYWAVRISSSHPVVAYDSDTIRLLDACSALFGSCSETESVVPQIAATWWYEAEVHWRSFARLGGVGGEVV
ncbi:hypothetical protein R3P38DRAFT_3368210 [Favolaschia claudopus]|uniref:Uncharacterized protein n=1 Tax=Favolaschia claudopus TaxID=2862362 RepID=A0AAW0A6J3_9AGAR